MLTELSFTYGGRTFTCRIGAGDGPTSDDASAPSTWRYRIDDGEERVAFPASPDDTQDDVRTSIIEHARIAEG